MTLTGQPRRQLQITGAGLAREEFMQVKSVWIAQQTTTANPFIMRTGPDWIQISIVPAIDLYQFALIGTD